MYSMTDAYEKDNNGIAILLEPLNEQVLTTGLGVIQPMTVK